MEIKLKLEVSETETTKVVELEYLDYTEEEWNALSKDEKEEALQTYADSLPNQPVWLVSSFGTL